MKHIDEWIDTPVSKGVKFGTEEYRATSYAKFFFWYKRYPAWVQMAFHEWMSQFKLFCDYEGKRYRVTGASRMGDIWLAEDLLREDGYDLRVDVERCSNWGDTPEGMSEPKPEKRLPL